MAGAGETGVPTQGAEPDAYASGWVAPQGQPREDSVFVLSGTQLGIGHATTVGPPVWIDLADVVNVDAIGEPHDRRQVVELSLDDGRVLTAEWPESFVGNVVDVLLRLAGGPAPDTTAAAPPAAPAPPAPAAPAAVPAAVPVPSGPSASPFGPPPTDAPPAVAPGPAAPFEPAPAPPPAAPMFGPGAAAAATSAAAVTAATDLPGTGPSAVAPAPPAAPAPAPAPPRPAPPAAPGPSAVGAPAGGAAAEPGPAATLVLEDVVYLGGYPGHGKKRKKCVATLDRTGLELKGPGGTAFRLDWDVVRSIEAQNADEARFRMNAKIHRDATALVLECQQDVTVLLEARDCPTVPLRSAIAQLVDGLRVVVV